MGRGEAGAECCCVLRRKAALLGISMHWHSHHHHQPKRGQMTNDGKAEEGLGPPCSQVFARFARMQPSTTCAAPPPPRPNQKPVHCPPPLTPATHTHTPHPAARRPFAASHPRHARHSPHRNGSRACPPNGHDLCGPPAAACAESRGMAGLDPTCPVIKNLLLLDAEGKRIAVKYYTAEWCVAPCSGLSREAGGWCRTAHFLTPAGFLPPRVQAHRGRAVEL